MEPVSTIDWWPSPAKINLFLHVCGRFENGYHELETLFQILDFGDEIGFELTSSGSIELSDPIKGVATQDNLIYKAANCLLPYRKNTQYGIKLHMQKSIPMGGGLGGGSSNAATVMVALNHLWECGLSKTTLLAYGLKLGADVPVFINGHSAFARGIGEQLENVKLPQCFFLVATPNEHIETAAVFSHPDLPRNTAKLDFSTVELEQLFRLTQNDCEKLVCNGHPKVANLLQWLLHYAPSRMTGTGASVFAQFESFEQAQNVFSQLPNDVSGFVAKGLDVSPLHEKLTQLHAKESLLNGRYKE